MWTLGTIAVFVALLVGLMSISWLALNILPRAASVAAALRARATAWGPVGTVAYIACWVLLFPLMILICFVGGVIDLIIELKGEGEVAGPTERNA